MSCCRGCGLNLEDWGIEDTPSPRDQALEFLEGKSAEGLVEFMAEAFERREAMARAYSLGSSLVLSVPRKTRAERAAEALERDRQLKRDKVDTAVRIRAHLGIPEPEVTEPTEPLYTREDIAATGGAEIHREDWPEVQAMVDTGELRWVGSPRGPNSDFRRVEVLG